MITCPCSPSSRSPSLSSKDSEAGADDIRGASPATFPASGWLAGAPRPVYLGGVGVEGGWLPVPVTVLIGRADALRRACELAAEFSPVSCDVG